MAKPNNVRALKPKDAQSITVTLKELVECTSEIPQIPGALDVLCGQRIPAVVSFRLSKIAAAINSELKHYGEAKKALGERYADKDAQGKAVILNAAGTPSTDGTGAYKIPPEKQSDATKELLELQATSVTIPGEMVKIGDLVNVTIAPAHLLSLSWLITE